jgi:drug/metabolite transporter (DMT)-like permease
VALLGLAAVRGGRSVTIRGLAFAGLSALVTACAVLSDSAGARAANDPIPYASMVTIGNALAMSAYHVRRIDLPRVLVEHWPITCLAPILSTASYLTTIWSLGHARVALVIALRETSMLFALAIGAIVLRERVGRWHGLAVAIVFAGVLLIRS